MQKNTVMKLIKQEPIGLIRPLFSILNYNNTQCDQITRCKEKVHLNKNVFATKTFPCKPANPNLALK